MRELTTQETADYLGLTAQTVRWHVAGGRLRPSRRIGPAYLFDQNEVARFAAIPRRSGPQPQTRRPLVTQAR